MGSGRVRRTPYVQQIQANYGQATADVMARKKKEQQQRQLDFENKQSTDALNLARQQHQLDQDAAKQEADQAKRAMGLQVGQLGMGLANRAAGNKNLQFGGTGLLSKAIGSPMGFNLGSLAGSGLAGYGAYQAMGGGAKGLAAGLGAGLVTDAMSGGGLTSSLMSGLTKVPGVGKAIGDFGGFLGGLF
jgi:hypothetical protein